MWCADSIRLPCTIDTSRVSTKLGVVDRVTDSVFELYQVNESSKKKITPVMSKPIFCNYYYKGQDSDPSRYFSVRKKVLRLNITF